MTAYRVGPLPTFLCSISKNIGRPSTLPARTETNDHGVPHGLADFEPLDDPQSNPCAQLPYPFGSWFSRIGDLSTEISEHTASSRCQNASRPHPKSRGFPFRHDVDMAGVTGSIPVAPTTQIREITLFSRRRPGCTSGFEAVQRAHSERRTPCFLRFSADGKRSERRHRGDVRDGGIGLGDGRSRRLGWHDSVAGTGGRNQPASNQRAGAAYRSRRREAR